MKIVEWTDNKGYKRKRAIKDTDSNESAIHGMPLEPPDLERLDWKQLKLDLYHNLMNRDLVSWQDVQYSQNGVTSAILATFKRKIIALYREK